MNVNTSIKYNRGKIFYVLLFYGLIRLIIDSYLNIQNQRLNLENNHKMFVVFLLLIFIVGLQGQDKPVVPTKPFTPKPIRITLNDLPSPFSTPSASKPAIVVPVPSNATLFVPDTRYRVTIYMDGLSTPRQIIYTPTGEILVTESSGNRISILVGNTRTVFADISNGISQVFGIAFYKVSI